MTWIEANCPTCGTVEITPDDMELALCTNHSPASYYSFICPVCADEIQKHAEERVVELLIAEGVAPAYWTLPAEMLEDRNGPPLTIDELLDFHLALEQPGWFEALTQTVH